MKAGSWVSNTERDSTYLLENSCIPLQWYKASETGQWAAYSSLSLEKRACDLNKEIKRREGTRKERRKQGGISGALDFIVWEGEPAWFMNKSCSEKRLNNILLGKQNKWETPPHAKFSKGNHDKWDPSFRFVLPNDRKLFSGLNEFSEMSWVHLEVPWKLWRHSCLSLETKKDRFLSSKAKPRPNGGDRESRCSFIDSSECWLHFHRHFAHYKNSHYKNCKIKRKLQICWVFITELIKA